MLTKNKKLLIVTASVLLLALVGFIIWANIPSPNAYDKLMTVNKAMDQGAYATMSFTSVKTMGKLLSDCENLAKLKFLSQTERTVYYGQNDSVSYELPENAIAENGKPLYTKVVNRIFKMKVLEVYKGTFTAGDEIEIVLPYIELSTPPNTDVDAIWSFDTAIGSHNEGYYSGGLFGIFYEDKGCIYPAYDLEEFTQEYVGMREDEFIDAVLPILEAQ